MPTFEIEFVEDREPERVDAITKPKAFVKAERKFDSTPRRIMPVEQDGPETVEVRRDDLENLVEGSSHLYECAFTDEQHERITESRVRVEEEVL